MCTCHTHFTAARTIRVHHIHVACLWPDLHHKRWRRRSHSEAGGLPGPFVRRCESTGSETSRFVGSTTRNFKNKTPSSSDCNQVCLYLNPSRTQAPCRHHVKLNLKTRKIPTQRNINSLMNILQKHTTWTCILLSSQHFGHHRHTTASNTDWDCDRSK